MNAIPTRRIAASLHLLPTAEGGRKTAINEDVYRPQFHLGPFNASCIVDRIDQRTLAPGQQGEVEMRILNPQRFGDALAAGGRFEIKEGLRVVGWGTITQVKE
jgi:translation elongation factor EF-Tu-like GTPase